LLNKGHLFSLYKPRYIRNIRYFWLIFDINKKELDLKFPQLFSRKAQSLVGVDISSSAVKLLELSKSGDDYKVESYAVGGLPPNSVVENNIADVEAVGEVVKIAYKRSSSSVKNAAVAVSGSAVITKIVQMQASLSEDEMENQIMVEADQYIPYSLDEVNLDFEVLGPTEGATDSVDVLLAASRTENVDVRVDAIELGGLNAKIVDIEAYAMENAFSLIAPQLPNGGLDQTVAIFDIGATMTTLSVIHDLKTVYMREAIFGGKQLTEEIQRRYGLSYEEAGMAKKQGGLPDTYEPEVLEPFKEAMTQEINRSLQFFFAATQYNSVDHIVLAGGSSSIQGIDQMVEERMSISTIIANPFSNMTLSSNIKAQVLSNDAPALMIACGLALRSFD